MKFLSTYGKWSSLLVAALIIWLIGRAAGASDGGFSWIGALFAVASSYFIGAIPFGVLVAQTAGLGDLRAVGSGNIGATNVLRTGNKAAAASTLLLDAMKGFLPVLLLSRIHEGYAVFALIGALLGHCFPVWLQFKGGKGVATYLGGLFALAWPLGIAACGIWAGMAYWRRISSLSALTVVVLIPLAAGFIDASWSVGLAIAAAIIIFQHRANIARLRAGTEPKIGKK